MQKYVEHLVIFIGQPGITYTIYIEFIDFIGLYIYIMFINNSVVLKKYNYVQT